MMLSPIVNQDPLLKPCSGRLEYVVDEYSISFSYQNAEYAKHLAWLCFGPIEVAVSCMNGQILGASGYIGRRRWIDSSLSPGDTTQPSAIVLEAFDQCQVGVGYDLNEGGFEQLKFNPALGWAHVGDGSASIDLIVEFATDCCAAIRNRRIVTVWLRPENWWELAKS